jgi:hypothetical protein
MPDEHHIKLYQADQPRSAFGAIMDDLGFVKAQLAWLPTQKDLACTSLGAIFDAAAQSEETAALSKPLCQMSLQHNSGRKRKSQITEKP